jgi:hypothetical protein
MRLTHRELFRDSLPRQAAIAGLLLGEFWRRRRQPERAVIAYQRAAADARKAGDLALNTCGLEAIG